MKSLRLKVSIAAAALAGSSLLLSAAAHAQTISSIYTNGDTAGTTTVSGTVSSILNTTSTTNTFNITDNTGSVVLYNIATSTYTPTVGDNITVSAYNSPYQGAPELIQGNGTTQPTAVITKNSAGSGPAPAMLTIAQFNTSGNNPSGTGATATQTSNAPYAESLITVDVTLPAGTTNLNTTTNTTYTITDGSGSGVLFSYHSYSATLAALNAANSMETSSGNTFYANPLAITGYVDVYKGQAELYPTSFASAPSVSPGTPMPEPSTDALLGLGGLALWFTARNLRRNRHA